MRKRHAKLDLSPNYQLREVLWNPFFMVISMFDGELTPSPGPGLFGIVQDPLGALGELFFGHPQRDGVSGTSMISMWFWWEKNMVVAVKLEGLLFTSDLEKNWAQAVA